MVTCLMLQCMLGAISFITLVDPSMHCSMANITIVEIHMLILDVCVSKDLFVNKSVYIESRM